jgi:hypothetical protein
MSSKADEKPKLLSSKAVFAPVVDVFEVPESARLNRELVEAAKDWQAQDPGITRSNFAGWHSDGNIFKRIDAPFLGSGPVKLLA